ncbi:MAG: hypothetical protein JWR02_368 [Mucilaginibacter sp.]|nr:hypothetical protein [Mucilaginibacter sp.]
MKCIATLLTVSCRVTSGLDCNNFNGNRELRKLFHEQGVFYVNQRITTKFMKYLKILVITIITFFTVGSAMAQVSIRAKVGGGDRHRRHYRHHRVWHPRRHDDRR